MPIEEAQRESAYEEEAFVPEPEATAEASAEVAPAVVERSLTPELEAARERARANAIVIEVCAYTYIGKGHTVHLPKTFAFCFLGLGL